MAAPAAAVVASASLMTHTACARPFTSGGARPAFAAQRRRQGAGGSQRFALCTAAAAQRVPDFIPAEFAAEIEEPAARAMMAAMRRVPLDVPGFGSAETAYVGPEAPTPARPAFVLLHGAKCSTLATALPCRGLPTCLPACLLPEEHAAMLPCPPPLLAPSLTVLPCNLQASIAAAWSFGASTRCSASWETHMQWTWQAGVSLCDPARKQACDPAAHNAQVAWKGQLSPLALPLRSC